LIPSGFVARVVPGALCVSLMLAGCGADTTLIQGDCATVHGSDICTWGESVGGAVTSFGATIPIGVIANAPAEMEMAWPPVASARIPLPEAVQTATGVQVLTVFWEPHGHPPGPYLTPHFDFHFYGISMAELDAIDCLDVSKPAQLAAGYEMPDVSIPELGDLIGLCVPAMGMHSLPSAEMNASELFAKTMVVGYYQTRPIFIEPMITAQTMLGRQSFTVDVPTVPGWPTTGQYPSSFEAVYDSTAESYRFVFSGLAGLGTR